MSEVIDNVKINDLKLHSVNMDKLNANNTELNGNIDKDDYSEDFAGDAVGVRNSKNDDTIDMVPTMDENPYTREHLTFATNKNIAEGMMDIALLSANANQLRFLITYNRQATFFYISLVLVIISLMLQLAVGIGLLVRRRWRLQDPDNEPFKTNTFIVGGIFLITMVNILLAALTTTDNNQIVSPNSTNRT